MASTKADKRPRQQLRPELLREAVRMHGAGATLSAISSRLGIAKSTLHDALQRSGASSKARPAAPSLPPSADADGYEGRVPIMRRMVERLERELALAEYPADIARLARELRETVRDLDKAIALQTTAAAAAAEQQQRGGAVDALRQRLAALAERQDVTTTDANTEQQRRTA